MARVAAFLLVSVLASACSPAPPASTASPGTLPSRAVLRADFEALGVKLREQRHRQLLASTNSNFGSSDRAFLGVEIVGDPVTAVIVNLDAFTMDSGGRFPGSALIDVMDSFAPGVKRWFVAKESDPRLAGYLQELDLNGLVAQIPATEVPGTVLVVETRSALAHSN